MQEQRLITGPDRISASEFRLQLSLSSRILCLLLCGLIQLTSLTPLLFAQTAPAPTSTRQVLHVRQLEDGKWFGWVNGRNRRTSVALPQTKEDIQKFADRYGVDVEWHMDLPVAIPETPEIGSPVASPAQQPLPPATTVVRTSNQTTELPPSGSDVVPATKSVIAPEVTDGTSLSVAEQITRFERTIATDSQRLEELRSEMTNPEGEYQQAETEFKAAEQELAQKQIEIAELKKVDKPTDLKTAEEALKGIQAKHELSRQRFDLAIETRKTVQEQMAALETKIAQDKIARDKLTGAAAPMSVTDAPPAQQAAADPMVTPAVPASTSSAALANPAVAAVMAPAENTETSSEETAPAQSGAEAASSAVAPEKPVSAELLEAQQQADIKKAEARVAELEAQSITERMQALDKTIELEQKLFNSARKKADIAYQQSQALQKEYQEKSDAGTKRSELQTIAQKRQDAETLFEKARAEVAERTDRLSQLQSERTALQTEEIAALSAAEAKKGEAAHAEEQVSTLQNPFSIHNLLQWLLDHGVKIALILCGILLLRSVLKLSTRRLVDLMVKSGARGTREEKEDRATTLVGVFQNAGSLTILVSGTLMICEEVGIAVGPLMGGAAVVGLAVAFGAQNLIRDYFYGFVILLENQYKINDILKIGDISGQVERITLRMTVLRDLEGRVHFIPNGKIDSVTNMTHGWSRAVFEIGVAYKEDADEVMKVLMELARGLRQDPVTAPMIIDDPEMLGVDSLADSAVVLKFVIKTRPLKQWAVKRELLRRIKRRFDELNIEIPFPHRTIYHHQVTAESDRGEDLGNYQETRAA